jgi:propionyl-CoA carboxylase beta chain
MSLTKEDKLNKLQNWKKLSELGGGEARIAKQHEQKKLTARERIERLCDPHSFQEFDAFMTHRCEQFGMAETRYVGDGVITGIGRINGIQVALYSQDFTCWGGALGKVHAQKICKVMDFAFDHRLPIIGLNDSGGARIQEGVESLAGYADIFYRNVKCSGVVPQISLILGPCAGGAVYSPAITDFIFMVEGTSYMFVTGPDVIKTVTHEEVTKEDLGGAHTHNAKSGVSHFKCRDEEDCFQRVRELLHFIPTAFDRKKETRQVKDSALRVNTKLKDLIPESSKRPYDMKELISDIVDDGHFLESQEHYAQNIICGFGQFDGRSVGIIANQPNVFAGVLDIDSSNKAARFVRFCDAFNISILTLVDVPGFLPGTHQEFGGIIKHGSKLLFAYAEATVPSVTLITRKAYGGAYDVMASKHIGADINLAYPTAEIAVMGAEGAVNIIFRKEIADLKGEKAQEKRQELIDHYQDEFAGPYQAAQLGYVDEIILPEETRQKICLYFKMLENKVQNPIPKKHGNIQL